MCDPNTCRDLNCPCDGPSGSWKPDPQKRFLTHGPGMTFTPDRLGGGTLSYWAMRNRKGFRPGPAMMRLKKTARAA